MTAEDVKTNFDWRITTPKGWKPVKHMDLIKGMQKVDVVDKYTVRVTLTEPFSSLMRDLAWVIGGSCHPRRWRSGGTSSPFIPAAQDRSRWWR